MKTFDHGALLYRILPSIYRERDESGDLRRFLEACGELLDQVQKTLIQRYADTFPDSSGDGRWPASQTWVLPYIAALLDVRAVSPHDTGRRLEIAHAIDWRKAKGTLRVAEDVAEAVGGFEVAVREGWKRVAVTPRPGEPLMPVQAHGIDPGEAGEPAPSHASLRARHPGLPAGTPDLRCPGGAVEGVPGLSGGGRRRTRDGVRYWKQSNAHGAPSCSGGSRLPGMPASFDDPTVRTVDLRSADWRVGHAHPRTLLLHVPVPSGRFGPGGRAFMWHPGLMDKEAFLQHVEVIRSDRRIVLRNRALSREPFEPVRLYRQVTLDLPGVEEWVFEGFVFMAGMNPGSASRVVFRDCALIGLEDRSEGRAGVLEAHDSFFKRVTLMQFEAELHGCTVLEQIAVESLNATDSLFAGRIGGPGEDGMPIDGCLRYCGERRDQRPGALRRHRVVRERPVFFETRPGHSACGLLHPATPLAVRTGAEDGGELGVGRRIAMHAACRAVTEKLKDFLPVGIEPVIVHDPAL